MHLTFFTRADTNSSVKSATNSMPVHIQRVRCSGRELSLLGCSYGRNLTHTYHSKDVAVKCKKGKRISKLLCRTSRYSECAGYSKLWDHDFCFVLDNY